jgi:hypothetical protein
VPTTRVVGLRRKNVGGAGAGVTRPLDSWRDRQVETPLQLSVLLRWVDKYLAAKDCCRAVPGGAVDWVLLPRCIDSAQ